MNKFEKQNPTISVTLFVYNDKTEKVSILRKSKFVFERGHVIDLLLIGKNEVKHYCIFKNLSRLLFLQIFKHVGKVYFCRGCLNYFYSEDSLKKHDEYCREHKFVKITMTGEKNKYIYFKNHYKQGMVPFVIYADFECINVPIDTSRPNPEKSYIKPYQKHVPSGFAYITVSQYEDDYKSKMEQYRGKDAAEVL